MSTGNFLFALAVFAACARFRFIVTRLVATKVAFVMIVCIVTAILVVVVAFAAVQLASW